MGNPARYGGTQPNKATSPSSKVNSLSPLVPRVKNTFDLTHQICQTERFADVMPFFVMDCVPNDDVKLESNIDQRPQSTFASPLMTTFRKHRSYFAVPRSAIYRRNYQQVFVNPKKGEDIDFSNVVACVNMLNLTGACLTYLKLMTESTVMNAKLWQCYFGGMILLQNLISEYSLLSYFGLNPFSQSIEIGSNKISEPGDKYFSTLLSTLTANGNKIRLSSSQLSSSYVVYDILSEWDVFAQDYLKYKDDASFSAYLQTSSGTIVQDGIDVSSDLISIETWISSQPFADRLVNIERLIAYQMCINQFYTNDNVDDLYTADLWYRNLDGLYRYVASDGQYATYVWNGLDLEFEPYSGARINFIVQVLEGATSLGDNDIIRAISYFQQIFCISQSLRFGDMFNSARLEPLAVGDYSAPVTSNEVSAVDMTKATLMQRFLNAVNSVRNTIKGYAQMLFGVIPDDLAPEPRFIAHSVIEIGTSIVANTGDNQGNLETNLVLHDSRPEFDIHVNQECIILGLSHYDCLQLYPRILDPMALKIDRFDFFNPMLQNIGDQPVPSALLLNLIKDSKFPADNIFGYLQNDYEYKQSLNQARGGYITGALVGASEEYGRSTWAFVIPKKVNPYLTSDFIRNDNGDFNIFFKSLTGNGVNYFHFVCSYVNQVIASRPMNYVSNILFNSSI